MPECLPCDLVISNYAFSECERGMQEGYLQRIIRHSKAGYMVYNFIGHIFHISPFSSDEWSNKLEEYGFNVLRESETPSPKDFSNLLFTWKRPD